MTWIEIPEVSQRLRARRKALGITQERLATSAGCGQPTIASMEGGYIPPRSKVLPKVLLALDELERKEFS